MGRSVWNGGLYPPGLVVERQSVVDGVVEVSGRLTGAVGRCPDCGTPSTSCHSRYVRTLSDLPISGAVVKLRLNVRRFRCNQHICRRKTFSETLAPSLGRRHGRRVARCDGLLHAVGLALGGRPGSRMMARLAAPWSKDTLLRAVRREAAAASPAPRGDGDRHRRLRVAARPQLRQNRRRSGTAHGHRHPTGSAARHDHGLVEGEPTGSDHLPGPWPGLWRGGCGGGTPGAAGGRPLAFVRERLRRFPVCGSVRTAPTAQGALARNARRSSDFEQGRADPVGGRDDTRGDQRAGSGVGGAGHSAQGDSAHDRPLAPDHPQDRARPAP